MLKRVVIQDSNFRDIQNYIVDTELDCDISIIKKVLDIETSSEFHKDFTEDRFFNQIDWEYQHYYIEDVEIYKI